MKDFKGYIFLASVLLLVYIVAQYNKPKPLDWTPTFHSDSKIPFATYIAYERLSDIFPGIEKNTNRSPLYQSLNTDTLDGAAIIIVADYLDIDSPTYDQLVKHMDKGNDVLIASSYFGEGLRRKLDIQAQTGLSKRPLTVSFVNEKVKHEKYFVDRNCTETYFGNFDTTRAVVLGVNSRGFANFLKFEMGKGSLYLNANPYFFTNYSLLKPAGAKYAATVLSYLNPRTQVVWDQSYSKGQVKHASTMAVFLRYIHLKWAFYLVFFGLIFYVLYQMKRRQRIIPVIEPVRNSSVEFATVVGQVYYEKRNNTNIARKKISYFLEDIRNRYHLRTNIPDQGFLHILSKKSGVDLPLIEAIFRQIKISHSDYSFSDEDLTKLNTNIEQFKKEAHFYGK